MFPHVSWISVYLSSTYLGWTYGVTTCFQLCEEFWRKLADWRKHFFFLSFLLSLSLCWLVCFTDCAEHLELGSEDHTFFILSTANLSQQASTFALRAMGDVGSGFRRTDRDGLGPAGRWTLTPLVCPAPIRIARGGGVLSETRAHRNIPRVNGPLKLIKQTVWGCSWACGCVVAAGDGFNSEEKQRYIMGPWLRRAAQMKK